jgi:hypothetical protein
MSSRICSSIALNVVRGRVEACETVFDLIENCKDNYDKNLNLNINITIRYFIFYVL